MTANKYALQISQKMKLTNLLKWGKAGTRTLTYLQSGLITSLTL